MRRRRVRRTGTVAAGRPNLAAMALFREREDDENDGIPVDLRQKVCPTCRRKVQPWEATCPHDGAIPVEGVQIGAVEDQILSRLNPDLFLDDEPSEDH